MVYKSYIVQVLPGFEAFPGSEVLYGSEIVPRSEVLPRSERVLYYFEISLLFCNWKLIFLRVNREKGEALALAAWQDVLRLKKRRIDRAPDELVKKTFLKQKAYQERDLVYENYLLFLQQAFGIRDLHWNIRNGHSGYSHA